MLKTISNCPNKSIIRPLSKLASVRKFERDSERKSPTEIEFRKRSIVMIDDEELCLTSMEMILFNTPYNLIPFVHAEPGIKYIQENHTNIELIFLDLMMPDISGLETLKILKAFSTTSVIPVIIQTASSNHTALLECYKLKALDYMIKPYSKLETIKKIKKILGF
jgi:response regulator RpfG family c-di-GMP phosphodiesterase